MSNNVGIQTVDVCRRVYFYARFFFIPWSCKALIIDSFVLQYIDTYIKVLLRLSLLYWQSTKVSSMLLLVDHVKGFDNVIKAFTNLTSFVSWCDLNMELQNDSIPWFLYILNTTDLFSDMDSHRLNQGEMKYSRRYDCHLNYLWNIKLSNWMSLGQLKYSSTKLLCNDGWLERACCAWWSSKSGRRLSRWLCH